MQQQQQPTPTSDTRSPRGGLKDAVGSVVDGGRNAPGPVEGGGLNMGVNMGVNHMVGGSNGLKESSTSSVGVNGSSGGGPPPSKRQVGGFVFLRFFCVDFESFFVEG